MPKRFTVHRCFYFLTLVFLMTGMEGYAQITRNISGSILDSLGEAVVGARINIYTGSDTLESRSDKYGIFRFSGVKVNSFSIIIYSLGFKPYGSYHSFRKRERNMSLETIVLKYEPNRLKDVDIRARVHPLKYMRDTVEYNAAAYIVRENDRVEDLLRQIPGVSIDDEGNVTAMGKEMTKLRVNGKDFFTSNVKDFINQLPADIIARLQIIDDYGDEANFTGIKTGQPQKMLNLVTKPGRGRGVFGNISSNAGTNNRYGLQANGNVWEEIEQIGLSTSANSTNNSAGNSRNATAGINYRDKFAEGITGSANYNYVNNRTESKQLNLIETINPFGTIFNNNNSNLSGSGGSHNLNLNVQSIAPKSYFQASLSGSMVNKESDNVIVSSQRGLIRQDLFNINKQQQKNPNVNINMAWARRMDKPGKSFSIGFSARKGVSNILEDNYNEIGYYYPGTDQLAKDSVLTRLMDTRNKITSFSADFRFSQPLRNLRDSLIRKNIDIAYSFSLNITDNNLGTLVQDKLGNTSPVDSLSSIYSATFGAQRVSVNYRYQAKKINYTLGVSALPNILIGRYRDHDQEINRTEFNFSPIANVSYFLSNRNSFSFFYNGSSNAPGFYQLQAVPNASNLQNVIVGNPNLRPSFNHSASLNYQQSFPKKGNSISFSLLGALTQDQIVSNVVLVRDTLNSLKQETHFENANGNFNIGGSYSWAMPFIKNILYMEYRGGLTYSNNVYFSNNIRSVQEGVNFSQSLNMKVNQKKFYFSADASYNFNSNYYSLFFQNARDIKTWQFNISARSFLPKNLSAGVNASKSIFSGYTLNAINPLMINANIEKIFLKNKQATIGLQAYDILNQGNNLIRSVTDNSITDSRTNQITRYFLISFTMRLQKFGNLD